MEKSFGLVLKSNAVMSFVMFILNYLYIILETWTVNKKIEMLKNEIVSCHLEVVAGDN